MTDHAKNNQTLGSPVIIGGMVGTGVGLLASAKMGRKVVHRIGQSDMLRKAGRELRQTAQEIIYDQAKIMLKQRLSSSLANSQNKLLHPLQEQKSGHSKNANSNQPETDMTDKYRDLKEEHKTLNENLQRIEKKLNRLVQMSDQ